MNKALKGVGASPGIAMGTVLILEDKDLSYERKKIKDIKKEKEKFKEVLTLSKVQLTLIQKKVEKEMGLDDSAIFKVHLMLLDDPELIGAVEDKIESEGLNVEAALDDVVNFYARRFAAMENEYMKERAADIKDVGNRVLKNLLGIDMLDLAQIDKEVILVSRDLTPSDTAQINKDKLLGFVTENGGRTSHTAIMARSLEVPAVIGVPQILAEVESGTQIILDGEEGCIISNPSKNQLLDYANKCKNYRDRRCNLAQLKLIPAQTQDGHRVKLLANVGTPEDIKGALIHGAEGVGLYRSEFLYMNRKSLPTEEEQFKAYKEVAEKVDGPIVIRTLDIGGDKNLPYLDLPEEANPFLGYRAIRISLDEVGIFKTQLRAILRASNYGDVKIMYPMISALEELRAANLILAEVQGELKEEGISFKEDLEVGIMIEIPSAAIIADVLAKETDFFSIGTNDLIQYTTATDRMNEKISHLYQPFHPALLRLIKSVVEAAHREGNWAGMCGEMAGDKRLAPFLLGVGLDEFSMSALSIPEVKDRIRSLTLEDAKKISQEALTFSTAKDVEDFLVSKLTL